MQGSLHGCVWCCSVPQVTVHQAGSLNAGGALGGGFGVEKVKGQAGGEVLEGG